MSNSSRSDSDNSFDVREILQIGSRCRELRKEKDILEESKPESFELIQMLELHVKSLSEARKEDKEKIQRLERELKNCYQEIDYLQDQQDLRNIDVKNVEEDVVSLELKLADKEILLEEVGFLREEIQRSNSEKLLLKELLKTREMELRNSTLCVEKLEESISSMSLESQCEIESLRLDMIALEQSSFEVKKMMEEIEKLKIQFEDSKRIIHTLNMENVGLKGKLNAMEMNVIMFSQRIEQWLEDTDRSHHSCESSPDGKENLTISKEMSAYGEVLGPLLSKLESMLEPEEHLRQKMETMSLQMQEYEFLVKQLKEELREEKLQAKEEAEDLAQEMAELRYQITGMLDEECKRRACIEQASLQRIAELEAQLQREQIKPLVAVRNLHKA